MNKHKVMHIDFYRFKKPSKAAVIYAIFKWDVDCIIFSFLVSYILQNDSQVNRYEEHILLK